MTDTGSGHRRPAGVAGRALTVVAALLALLSILLAVASLWTIGAILPLRLFALALPLHLLVLTVAAAVLGQWAWRRRVLVATALYGLVVVLTATMALVPSIALWQRARQLDAPISLGDYLRYATDLNVGGPQPRRTVTYGTTADGTQLRLDIWRATGNGSGTPHPAIVKMHGGAFQLGARGEQPMWNAWLNDLGYDVFDIDYRLTPQATWTDEVGDVKCALGWVATHADEYHLDPARISTMGDSAGGNLAMLAAYTSGDPALPPSCPAPIVAVRSVISLFGPTDLTRLYHEVGEMNGLGGQLRDYLGGTPEQYPDRYRAVSPLTRVTGNAPPTLAFQGQRDFFSDNQARLLDDSLSQAEVAHQVVLLPATSHSYDTNWGGFATQITRTRIERFLRTHG